MSSTARRQFWRDIVAHPYSWIVVMIVIAGAYMIVSFPGFAASYRAHQKNSAQLAEEAVKGFQYLRGGSTGLCFAVNPYRDMAVGISCETVPPAMLIQVPGK
jgi:hypothetical protein